MLLSKVLIPYKIKKTERRRRDIEEKREFNRKYLAFLL